MKKSTKNFSHSSPKLKTSGFSAQLSINEGFGRVASFMRLDEVPPQYREKYKVLARGTTAIVMGTDTSNEVLILTKDQMKYEWLVGCIGIRLGEDVEVIENQQYRRHHIPDQTKMPIYVIKMPRLNNLSPTNKKLVKKDIDEFTILRLNYRDAYMIYQHLPNENIIFPQVEFALNYDESQYVFDIHMGNFMEDKDGNIVLIDPLVDREIINLIRGSSKQKGHWRG